jgi:hypothetical protein
MKQTAVEWLVEKIQQANPTFKFDALIREAKAMEKEQMIGFAKNFEHIDISKSDIENELNCYLNLEDTEELLKEPFKSE